MQSVIPNTARMAVISKEQSNNAVSFCWYWIRPLSIKSETALAFRRFDNYEPITLLPFRVDHCDLRDDDDLDYYLICQQIVDGCPPDAQHIQDLIDRISEIMLASS